MYKRAYCKNEKFNWRVVQECSEIIAKAKFQVQIFLIIELVMPRTWFHHRK